MPTCVGLESRMELVARMSEAKSGKSRPAFRCAHAGYGPDLGYASPRIDHVGAALERGGEAAECGIEHSAHEQAEHAALELVGNEKLDLATVLAARMK